MLLPLSTVGSFADPYLCPKLEEFLLFLKPSHIIALQLVTICISVLLLILWGLCPFDRVLVTECWFYSWHCPSCYCLICSRTIGTTSLFVADRIPVVVGSLLYPCCCSTVDDAFWYFLVQLFNLINSCYCCNSCCVNHFKSMDCCGTEVSTSSHSA